MTTILLLVIYLAFIGLGLPDSLFGTAWPAIYTDFSLPIAYGSLVSVTVSAGTIISSLMSGRLIRKFGTGKVTAFSTLLTALALGGFAFVPNIACMVLLAVPLGIGAGSIDVGLNNYVALHYSARVMSFLHCFYGIGVSVSPYILSLVISGPGGWRTGYRIAAGIQAGITAIMFLSLPLWKKAHLADASAPEETMRVLSVRQTLAIPGVRSMCSLFFISCAIECICSGWGSTFLVEHRHLTTDQAAQVILLYFVGMAAGRFLSGVLAARLHSWNIIRIGQGILCAALLILLFPGTRLLYTAGFFLVGLGNGPMFPNFNYLTPESFGKDISQSVISVQMAFSYVGILLGPLLCGLVGQAVGMFIFPVYLLALGAAMVLITWRVRHMLHQGKKAA